MPLTYIAAGVSIASGRWQHIALFAVFVAGVHLVISIVAVRMVRERPWHLLAVPLCRLIYEPLRTYVLYKSLPHPPIIGQQLMTGQRQTPCSARGQLPLAGVLA
jgi:hypothetical protein